MQNHQEPSMSQLRYRTRLAESGADLDAVQRLRYQAFCAGKAGTGGRDADAFDDRCSHIMVEHGERRELVATLRLMRLASGRDIQLSYSAQHYDLSRLSGYDGTMIEVGRFCNLPGHFDPGSLHAAWGALAAFVDRSGAGMLFGCSSFQGTRAGAYADAFAMLGDQHLAPRHWRPRIKAPDVLRFARRYRRAPDRAKALRTMPPLLRSYLSLGGWVSDHAVVDRDLDTLHVFTALEVRAIPPSRVRVLRAAAG